MLHSLPIPKPDELFYSVIARFVWRNKVSSPDDVNQLLFGDIPKSRAILDLPRRLDMFQAKVPSQHPLSHSNLLEEHTLFPICAPFMPADTAELLAQQLRGDTTKKATRTIRSDTKGTAKDGLRVCPQCLAADWNHDGEAYWRRLHRVPGVIVCPEHRVFLNNTGIGGPGAKYSQSFLIPPDSLQEQYAIQLSSEDAEHNDFFLMAQHAQWMLSQHHWRVESGAWSRAYRSKLDALGYTAGKHDRNLDSFEQTFDKRFPASFLSRIGAIYKTDQPDRNWLGRLILNPNAAHPPWRHFLMWILLDIAPGQIRQQLLMEKDARPVGSTPWLTTLKLLWPDPTVSFNALCIVLGKRPATVRRIARSLDLPFPRKADVIIQTPARIRLQQKRAIKLQERKIQWISLCEQHPKLKSTELQTLEHSLYSCIAYADPQWIKQHLPEPSTFPHNRAMDLVEDDNCLLAQLKTAYDKMVKSSDFPEKRNRNTFKRVIAGSGFSTAELARRPQTLRFLTDVTESPIQFAVRCLHHVAAQMRKNGSAPTPKELQAQAQVSGCMAAHPSVRAIIIGLCTTPSGLTTTSECVDVS
jgi:hypothetical protein